MALPGARQVQGSGFRWAGGILLAITAYLLLDIFTILRSTRSGRGKPCQIDDEVRG